MAGDFDIEDLLDSFETPSDKVISEVGVAHVPVILLVDTSSSMSKDLGSGRSIDLLNDCLQSFFQDIIQETTMNDQTMRSKADFCIIEYNSSVNVVMPWTHGSDITMDDIPHLETGGSTQMYQAVIEASSQLLEQFAAYKKQDVEAYCANIFNITDGAPDDDATALERAKKAVRLFATAGSQENPYGIFYHMGVPGYVRAPLLELAANDENVKELTNGEMSSFFEFIRASLNEDQLKLLAT